MKRLFIVNKNSGNKDKKEAIGRIQAFMDQEGGDYQVFSEDIRAHDAQDLLRGVDHLIALGGDGTAHWAINLLMKTQVRNFSLIPLGSANDFAKAMNISGSLEDQLARIVRSQARPLDLGLWGKNYFLNVGCIGYDSAVIQNLDRGLASKVGKYAIYKSIVKTALNYRPIEVELEIGGQRIQGQTAILAIANAPFYGGGVPIARQAQVDDGYLDLVHIGQDKFKFIIPFFASLLTGTEDIFWKKAMTRARIQDITIRSNQGAHINLDGEIYPQEEEARVRVLPGALAWIG